MGLYCGSSFSLGPFQETMSHPSPQISSSELLELYLRARDEAEAEAALAELRKFIHPMLMASFRKDFHVSMREADGGELNQDALELVADAELALVRKLRRMRSDGENGISTLEGYVRTITRNAFSQYVRTRRPVWTSLRNQIKYALSKSAGLFLRRDNGGWLCGVAGTAGEAVAQRQLTDAEIDELRGDKRCSTVSGTVAAMLEAYGAPVPLDQLVSDVFAFRRLREPAQVDEGLASKAAASGGEDHGCRIEQRELLEKLWREVERLPLLHKRILLLNLTNRSGESLIAELPLLRVASIEKIARALEFGPEEFAELWPRLPLSDNEIAERFSLSRQQVINLRHSARASLKRRLERGAK